MVMNFDSKMAQACRNDNEDLTCLQEVRTPSPNKFITADVIASTASSHISSADAPDAPTEARTEREFGAAKQASPVDCDCFLPGREKHASLLLSGQLSATGNDNERNLKEKVPNQGASILGDSTSGFDNVAPVDQDTHCMFDDAAYNTLNDLAAEGEECLASIMRPQALHKLNTAFVKSSKRPAGIAAKQRLVPRKSFAQPKIEPAESSAHRGHQRISSTRSNDRVMRFSTLTPKDCIELLGDQLGQEFVDHLKHLAKSHYVTFHTSMKKLENSASYQAAPMATKETMKEAEEKQVEKRKVQNGSHWASKARKWLLARGVAEQLCDRLTDETVRISSTINPRANAKKRPPKANLDKDAASLLTAHLRAKSSVPGNHAKQSLPRAAADTPVFASSAPFVAVNSEIPVAEPMSLSCQTSSELRGREYGGSRGGETSGPSFQSLTAAEQPAEDVFLQKWDQMFLCMQTLRQEYIRCRAQSIAPISQQGEMDSTRFKIRNRDRGVNDTATDIDVVYDSMG